MIIDDEEAKESGILLGAYRTKLVKYQKDNVKERRNSGHDLYIVEEEIKSVDGGSKDLHDVIEDSEDEECEYMGEVEEIEQLGEEEEEEGYEAIPKPEDLHVRLAQKKEPFLTILKLTSREEKSNK